MNNETFYVESDGVNITFYDDPQFKIKSKVQPPKTWHGTISDLSFVDGLSNAGKERNEKN